VKKTHESLLPAWKIFCETATSQWMNTSSTHLAVSACSDGSHFDTKNLTNQVTWVFIFGNFTGGQVLLQNLGIQIEAKGLSAYGFLAKKEKHGIKNIEPGNRLSVIGFSHENIFSISVLTASWNLDPWLKSDKRLSSKSEEEQAVMTDKEKLDYVHKKVL